MTQLIADHQSHGERGYRDDAAVIPRLIAGKTAIPVSAREACPSNSRTESLHRLVWVAGGPVIT